MQNWLWDPLCKNSPIITGKSFSKNGWNHQFISSLSKQLLDGWFSGSWNFEYLEFQGKLTQCLISLIKMSKVVVTFQLLVKLKLEEHLLIDKFMRRRRLLEKGSRVATPKCYEMSCQMAQRQTFGYQQIEIASWP